MEQKNKKLTTVIVILAVLLCLSATAFVGTLLYNRFVRTEPTTVDVPGNIITPEGDSGSAAETDPVSSEYKGGTNDATASKTDITVTSHSDSSVTDEPETTEKSSVSSSKASAVSLHSKNPEENKPFEVTNMFPGDIETEYYRIKVSYKGDIIVRYHADIRPGYEKLAEVLKVRIRLLGSDGFLYDGLMRDMPKSLNHALYTDEKTQSELYYEITAYLDTSVGNEYQDKELIADFRWWVEETENLYSPQMGVDPKIYLWFALAAGSLFLLIVLLAKRRKESADEC